jgi:hypothetical protein
MSYNVTETLLGNILGTPFAMSEGNMAIVDINAPGSGSLGGEASAPDGTWVNPFRSIQAAVDATPVPNLGDPKTLFRTILIFPGIYDENVIITQPNIMALLTIGQVFLSGSFPAGPVPPADIRHLVYNVDVIPVPFASLSILPLDGYPRTRGGQDQFWITGSIVLAGDAGDPFNSDRGLALKHVRAKSVVYASGAGSVGDPNYYPRLEGKISVQMERCTLEEGMVLPDDIVRYRIIWERVQAQALGVLSGPGSIGGTDSSISLIRCHIEERVVCPEAKWDLCQDTEIGDSGQPYPPSEMWNYGLISNSSFGNGLTVHDTVPDSRGRFTNTNIKGTVSAGAGMLRLDPVTNWYVNANGVGGVGAGVRTLIHDETIL